MNRLRELRKETGIPLREFSEIIGMDFSNLARIERGNVKMNELLICDLCKYFNCTSDYLLGLSSVRSYDELIENPIPQIFELNDANKELAKNFVKMLLEQQKKK